MVQTYQGYFIEDGRFISDSALVKLPTRRRAIVNILEEEVGEIDAPSRSTTSIQDKLERIRSILTAAKAEEDSTLSDDDWNEMLSLRAQSNTGLSRAVEV